MVTKQTVATSSGAFVIGVTAVAYTWAAPHGVLGGDNGEFSAIFAAGGVAHPPGFPTMVLWLRLWHWLPVSSPAYGAALATVLLGVGAVASLQWACRAWSASPGATAVATAVFALSPVAWDQGSHAEAFAMNALFAGCLLAMSAPPRPEDGPRGLAWLVGLGLLAGVATGGHQTIVLLGPSGLYAAVLAVRRSPRRAVAAIAGVVALAVGVALPELYLYVSARAATFTTQPVWIDAPTLAGVVDHVRRAAYGTLSLAPSGLAVPRDPVAAVWRCLAGSTQHLLGLPVLIPLAVLVRQGARARLAAWRAPGELIALGGSYLLAGPIFAAAMNLTSQGAGPRVAERFLLLPDVIACLGSALALTALLPWLSARTAAAATVTAGVVAGWVALPSIREARRADVAWYLDNVLASAPEDAVIVATGDQCWGAFLYARYALHSRPDVAFVNPGLAHLAWYRRQATALTGAEFDTPAGGAIGPRTMMRRLLRTGRPVLYAQWPDPVLETTPHDTVGPLMRVWNDGRERPSVDALLAANLAAFASFRIDPAPPLDPTAWGRPLYEAYARAWVELAQRLAQAGRLQEAQGCVSRASALAPWALTGLPAAP